MGGGAGNGSVPPVSQTKPAAQPNGRAVAGQQWQPPQAPSSAKPMPQEVPATESVKMSPELRVGPFTLAAVLMTANSLCPPVRDGFVMSPS